MTRHIQLSEVLVDLHLSSKVIEMYSELLLQSKIQNI
jgi:hypothetical protein